MPMNAIYYLNNSAVLAESFGNELMTVIASGARYTGNMYAGLKSDTFKIGAVAAVKLFLWKEMCGNIADYGRLYGKGLTHLMIEQLVVNPKYERLFTMEEVCFCRQFFLPEAA